jgi:hypothetical protein
MISTRARTSADGHTAEIEGAHRPTNAPTSGFAVATACCSARTASASVARSLQSSRARLHLQESSR